MQGGISYRAAAIAFSFFMALFPFALFILNLIPFIPIENFQADFINFVGKVFHPPPLMRFLKSSMTSYTIRMKDCYLPVLLCPFS